MCSLSLLFASDKKINIWKYYTPNNMQHITKLCNKYPKRIFAWNAF